MINVLAIIAFICWVFVVALAILHSLLPEERKPTKSLLAKSMSVLSTLAIVLVFIVWLDRGSL